MCTYLNYCIKPKKKNVQLHRKLVCIVCLVKLRYAFIKIFAQLAISVTSVHRLWNYKEFTVFIENIMQMPCRYICIYVLGFNFFNYNCIKNFGKRVKIFKFKWPQTFRVLQPQYLITFTVGTWKFQYRW